MKKEYLIAGLVAATVISSAVVYRFYFVDKAIAPTENENSAGAGLLPQINNEGPVEVSVAPVDLSPASQNWDFQITLSTHSEELNADMTKVSFLIGKDGREYLPVSWDGAPPGGHHRQGILRFKPIDLGLGAVTLKIREIGGVAERAFRWIVR